MGLLSLVEADEEDDKTIIDKLFKALEAND